MPNEESHSQLVSFLLRLAGARPVIPEDVTRRVHSAVHAQWRQTVRGRLYRRWAFAFLAPAVALSLLYVLSLHLLSANTPSSVPVGFVEALNGSVLIFGAEKGEPSGHSLTKGDVLMSESRLETGNSGRLLFHALGTGTLRMDVNSRLYLRSDSTFVLDRGAVYVDSEKHRNRLTLQTSQGTVRDVGTQFEVRSDGRMLRIRVREGLVSLDTNGRSTSAAEGTELAVDPKGRTSSRNIRKYGPEWDWVSEIAPTFLMDGQTLQEYLRWVARENGWSLTFEEPSLQQKAAKTILHGSIRGISPGETPDVVLPVCGLSYNLTDGVLTIKPGNRT